jgi:hypothetical protein
MALGIDINTIQNATPNNLKKQGIDRLSDILIKKGEEIKTQIEPKLIQEIKNAKDEFLCSNQEKLNNLIQVRNNIVDRLNSISNFLDQTTSAFAGIATLFELLTLVKNVLDVTLNVGFTAASLIPSPPGIPGPVVTGLIKIAEADKKLTFDNLGNPRLEKLRNISGGAAIATSLLSVTIKGVILLLNQLDALLIKCSNITLTPINQNLIDISNQAIEAENSPNENIYEGFVIQIETVPFSNTVNRFKAIGLNSDNIKLIETPLSFTTNQQTLIDELKFIIDRDNLKAN